MIKPITIGIFLVVLLIPGPAFGQTYEKVFSDRAGQILDYAADSYELPTPNYSDPEKVYWPVVIARLEKYGLSDPLANALLDSSVFTQKLPFHFILVGMARIMSAYPGAPAMEKNHTTYLKNVMARTDCYNPWTSEGTENHTNMCRTSGYLFAEQMLQYPLLFPDAPRLRLAMKDWLEYYVNRTREVGTGEFNASTYGIYNIIGFLNLYDFAKDTEVKALAGEMLDYYACELAVHHFKGMTSGAESRGAPSDESLSHETEWLSWLWFGDLNASRLASLMPRSTCKIPLQAVHAATSSYRPAPSIVKLAGIKNSREEWYVNSKPSYLLSTPGFIPQYLFNHPSFTLGSASYPYGAFSSAAYKNTTWKLLSATAPSKPHPQMVTGGGMYYPDRKGMMRDPYLQTAQYKNTLVMLYRLPPDYLEIHEEIRDTFRVWRQRWEEDFIQRFSAGDEKITSVGNPVNFQDVKDPEGIRNGCYIRLPEGVRDTVINQVLFVDLDYTWLAIRSLNQATPLVEENRLVVDHGPPGQLTGLILEVYPKEGRRDFFKYIFEYLEATRLAIDPETRELVYQTLDQDKLSITYQSAGSFIEPIYDWGYGPQEARYIQTSPPWIQPDWPAGEGYGRIPEFRVNGKKMPGRKAKYLYHSQDLKIFKGKIRIKKSSGKR